MRRFVAPILWALIAAWAAMGLFERAAFASRINGSSSSLGSATATTLSFGSANTTLSYSAGYLAVPNFYVTNSFVVDAATSFTNAVVFAPQTLTIANNSVGSSQATATLTPTSDFVNCTCNDPDGCAVTMGETGMTSGRMVLIVSTTTTACNFADTSGVTELTGAVALGQWDSLSLLYVTDRWVQLTTSNN